MKDLPDIDYSKVTVAFDCDGTLVNDTDLIPKMYRLYRFFKGLGCDMIVWSSAGTRWANDVNARHNLGGRVIDKWSIVPNIAVDDDFKHKYGKYNIYTSDFGLDTTDPDADLLGHWVK